MKSKLFLHCTGRFKVLRLGPYESGPDREPVGDKPHYLKLPSDRRGPNAKRRVSVMGCKLYMNPDDTEDRPWDLAAVSTEFVLANVSKKSPRSILRMTMLNLL